MLSFLRNYALVRYVAYLVGFILWLGPLAKTIARTVTNDWRFFVGEIRYCELSHRTNWMSQRKRLRDIDFNDI